ncbi:MAG TPA: type IV secretion system protein [Caulobacteraceae bacterium]|jgi:type IV secretion system protein VirB6
MSGFPGCPAFDSQDLGIAHALASVDCRVGLAVASSYGRLFGHNGAFGTVLTVLLTLYVAFIALALLTGRTRLTLSGMVPKVLAVGLVLTFATSWPAYHTVIYGLLVGGPEQIAAALTGGGGDTASFAERLDDLLSRLADATKAMGDDVPGGSKALGPLAGPQIASSLVWISGMLILLASAGALVLTRIILALLLAIGPVFVVLALFRQTRGLFESWLRTGLLFAFAPTLTVLAGSAALALLAPLIDVIADDPAGAVKELRPVLELFMGSAVYAGLVAMLMWTSASLVRSWRFGDAHESPSGSASSPAGSSFVPSAPQTAAAAASSTRPADPRVGQVIASLARDGGETQAAAVSVRVERASAALQSAAEASPRSATDGQRRTEGLGQGYRLGARPARLSGAVR